MQMRLPNAGEDHTINQSGMTGAPVIYVPSLATPVVSRNPVRVHMCLLAVSPGRSTGYVSHPLAQR